ncbi:MAG TPA: COX15/CtaA family protein [Vicinamibacterales bacterium]|nr:COX15/CtaA family protein [Vicinamibacterales bacterium]
MPRVARFAWSVLAYNVAVILWGAYVRATGSGAGCGSHWPLCDGQIIPRDPGIATLIELSHRITSGIALIAVVVLLVWVFRACASGHPARTGAVLSLVLILFEAAIGAGLVLFELVADNASMARALFMGAHLINTFVLLACLALTAYWLSGEAAHAFAAPLRTTFVLGTAALGLLASGASGAVAALGDTLYPASSLAEALRSDLSPASHLLIRLRVLHPAIAIGTAVWLMLAVPRTASPDGRQRGLARLIAALAVLQLALGALNVVLLAPVWMQLVHLLVADALWIAFVIFSAGVLAEGRPARAHARAGLPDPSSGPVRAM